MPCCTIVSHIDNLTTLFVERLITSFGRFEMCEHLFLPIINVLQRVVFALMQMPFDGSDGFLGVGGNPVHDDDQ